MTLEELQKKKEEAINLENTGSMARLGSGLAAYLYNFGGSGEVTNKAYQDAGAQMKAMAPEPVKELKAVDVGGKPYYMTPEKAQFEQGYVKPFKESTGGSFSSKLLKNIDPKSADFGKVTMGFQKGLGFVDSDSNPIPSSYVEWKAEKTSSAKTPSGGQTLSGISPYTGAPRTIVSTPGSGDVMAPSGHPMLKEEAIARLKSAAKGKDVLSKIDLDTVSTGESKKVLLTTSDPMVFSTTVGDLIRKSVGEKRLSDIEGAKYMGGDYKGFKLRGKEYLISKYGGEIPESVRQNALHLVDLVEKRLSSETAATRKSYGDTSGLSDRGRQAIGQTIGVQPVAPVQEGSVDWKSKYR